MAKTKTLVVGSTALILMSAAAIKKQQDTIAKLGTDMLELIRENSIQCLAHFKKHGDITLAERLLASVPRGMVVAGLAKWFADFAPVKFDQSGKATVTGKPSETKLEAAAEKDWTADASVRDRATRPIEPFNISFVKKRIMSLKSQYEKALKDGGRGVGVQTEAGEFVPYTDEQKKQLEDFLSRLATTPVADLKATESDTVIKPSAVKPVNAKGESRAKVQTAKRSARTEQAKKQARAVNDTISEQAPVAA